MAIATWMLCLVTTCAFVAAYEAARKAGEALHVANEQLKMERELVLGVWFCSKSDHSIPRAEMYVVGNKLQDVPAPGKRDNDYVPYKFDFQNLGRSALRNVIVPIQLDNGDPLAVDIGNIATDDEAHVVLQFEWDAPTRPVVSWQSPAIVDGTALAYTTLPPLVIARNFPIDDQTGGMEHGDPSKKKWRVSPSQPEDRNKAAGPSAAKDDDD